MQLVSGFRNLSELPWQGREIDPMPDWAQVGLWALAALIGLMLLGAFFKAMRSEPAEHHRYEYGRNQYLRSLDGSESVSLGDAEELSEGEDELALCEIQEDLRNISKGLRQVIEEMEATMRGVRESDDSQYALPSDSHCTLPDDSRYALLGVSPEAALDDIKRAYHAKVALWHPDKLQDVDPELQQMANTRLAEINAAYDSLCSERV